MKKSLIILFLFFAGISTAFAQAPSASALVKAFQQTTATNPHPIVDFLNANGYTYRFVVNETGYEAEYLYSKNCKILHEQYSNGVEYSPSPETAKSSIVRLFAQGDRVISMNVYAYSPAAFKTWDAQLKALGYKARYDGAGNRGKSWEYRAKGKPNISIWNDLSNTYILYISK